MFIICRCSETIGLRIIRFPRNFKDFIERILQHSKYDVKRCGECSGTVVAVVAGVLIILISIQMSRATPVLETDSLNIFQDWLCICS